MNQSMFQICIQSHAYNVNCMLELEIFWINFELKLLTFQGQHERFLL